MEPHRATGPATGRAVSVDNPPEPVKPVVDFTFFDDHYAPLCSLLRDGDTVVDVGCYGGWYANAVRHHLLEKHGIRVRTVGIDCCQTEGLHGGLGGRQAAARASLDEFVLSRVEDIHHMDGVADVVACVGFPRNFGSRRDAIRRVAALLKPNGFSLFSVYEPTDARGGVEASIRVLSKAEAVEHAELCVTPSDDGKCRHGYEPPSRPPGSSAGWWRRHGCPICWNSR